MAFTGAAPNQFSEVCVSAVAAISRRDPSPTWPTQYKKFSLATREVIEWKSTDGTAIQGILIKPANFDPAQEVSAAGGDPRRADGRGPAGAVAGCATIRSSASRPKARCCCRPNYRGSAGYGEKFRSLNVRNLGMGDYEDVISGVDALIAQRLHRSDRVGAMGWSQGGYISAFITCYQRPFQGGVGGRGNFGLDDVLRQHRHHAVHAPVSEGDAVGRSGDLPQDVADLVPEEREDADADPARRARQARADPQRLRVAPGAGGSRACR